jgi:hypothetical protein
MMILGHSVESIPSSWRKRDEYLFRENISLNYAMKSDFWTPNRLVLITCVFGHELILNTDIHTVSPEGVVSPSWVCTIAGCTYHEHITLSGWKYEEPIGQDPKVS